MFYVRAVWDDEAKVFYSESDIPGLHIEAESIDEFERVMKDVAHELVIRNHLSKRDLARASLADLIPSILWQRLGTSRRLRSWSTGSTEQLHRN